jgi:hypothetical protein
MTQKEPASEGDNPYRSPAVTADATEPRPDEPTAREVFWAWERLRIYFNLILLAETLLLGLVAMGLLWPHLLECFVGALVANVCFCVGPMLEGYAEGIGVPRGVARGVIFVMGMLVAMAFTWVSIGTLVDK